MRFWREFAVVLAAMLLGWQSATPRQGRIGPDRRSTELRPQTDTGAPDWADVLMRLEKRSFPDYRSAMKELVRSIDRRWEGQVRGFVKMKGSPLLIEGLRMRLSDQKGTAKYWSRTDEAGGFVFDAVPYAGKYRVEVRDETRGLHGGKSFSMLESQCEVVVPVARRLKLSGIVRSRSGEAIRGANVVVEIKGSTGAGSAKNATTDTSGAYTVEVGESRGIDLTAELEVRVSAWALGWFAGSMDTIAEPGVGKQAVEPVVLYPGTTVSGRVVDLQGRPIAGVAVRAGFARAHAVKSCPGAPLPPFMRMGSVVSEGVQWETVVVDQQTAADGGFVVGAPFRPQQAFVVLRRGPGGRRGYSAFSISKKIRRHGRIDLGDIVSAPVVVRGRVRVRYADGSVARGYISCQPAGVPSWTGARMSGSLDANGEWASEALRVGERVDLTVMAARPGVRTHRTVTVEDAITEIVLE